MTGKTYGGANQDAKRIHVNQVGYLPQSIKRAVFTGTFEDSTGFQVVDSATGAIAFKGVLSGAIDNPGAGEQNRIADFTPLTAAGQYRIVGPQGVRSADFSISENVYDKLFKMAARMLYLQRCGMALDAAHAGDYAHPPCHSGLAVIYGTEERIDVRGGWHDAGDYGRYIVPGAKAAADLMLAAEARGRLTDDIGTPDSGDGLDDLLQEAKFELDWMLKMQAPSGGAYHKVTCRSFPGFVMPEEETEELVVCPISNAATGDFAAAMAMAGRVMADSWPEDAARYTLASERAWAYLKAHRGDPGFKNPEGIVTGEYGDDFDTDEVFWAAAELHRTTGRDEYRRAAADLITTGGQRRGLGWENVGTYGMLAIVNDPGYAADDPLRLAALDALRGTVDAALELIEANPYGADRAGEYEWGSNMGVANTGALLALAAELLGDGSLRAAAQQPLDYLLGRNATGYCFVTGIGTKTPEHPHHRPSVARGKAMPGMLVGGPDNGLHDPCAKAALVEAAPARCYVDDAESYSTNEICIYWNSPLLLLLAAMGC